MTRLALIAIFPGLLLASQATDEKEVKSELSSLEGTWVYQSLQRDGKLMPAEDVRKISLSIQGTTYTVKVGDKILGPGVLAIDPSKTPKTIDITPSEGADKNKTSLGIYQADGESLKACFALPGKNRPSEFSANPGSGQTVGVLKRMKS